MTRREKQEQTRARILDAGLGVFRSRGYARTTIEDVAELAGITRGTVYLHFGTKQGLFLAIAEEHLEEQVAAFRARVEVADDRDALLDVLLSVVSPTTQRPTVLLDWAVMLADLHEGEPELLRRAQRVQARVDDEVASLVAKLCHERAMIWVPPVRLARLLLALGNGLTARAALDPGLDLAAEFATAVELLVGDDR